MGRCFVRKYVLERLFGETENSSLLIKVSPIIFIDKGFSNNIHMATIALMIGGAVLNATAFVGGSYLAKYLSGSNTDTERIRHDKAIEKYQRDYAAYQEKRQRLLDWYNQQRDEEHQASQNLTDTDEAFKLYSQTHPDYSLQEPRLSDYYRPSDDQRMGEMAYVGGGMLALGYVASKFL